MRVVVTGADGFTGSHLVKYLKKFGHEVVGCDKRECDVLDKEALERFFGGFDAVVHLAAVSYTAFSDYEPYYRINTIGTHNVLEAAFDAGIKKVVVASSAAVYGKQKEEVLHEGLCPNPQNHYALSKYCAEGVAKSFFEKMEVIVTRPFNYTGVGQSEMFVIPKIVQHYCKKKPLTLGNIKTVREYNDIGFVCEAYRRLLEKEVDSTIVNIASGRGVSLEEVLDVVKKLKGEVEITIDPSLFRPNEPKILVGSAKKLFALIGSIEQPPLEETLQTMLDSAC